MKEFFVNLIRKDRQFEHHDNGLSWLLILLAIILAGIAVSIFNAPYDGEDPVVGPLVSDSPTPLESAEVRPPRLYTVSYKGGVFSPTNLRIHSGDTVRFHNDGLFSIHLASDPHPAHDDLVGFDSVGDIPPGSFFTFTFAARGTFGYHNENEIKEKGTIIVR